MKHKHQLRRRAQAGFSLIELLIVVAIIGILAAVALPRLQENLKLGKQTAAINTLRTIHQNEAQFNAMKGKFGNLQDLAQAQLIDGNYASGTAINGYAYTSPVADADKYCVQATRQAASTAYRDFNVIEDGTIRFSETKTPSPVAHGEGSSLSGGETGGTQGQGAAQPKQ